MSGSNASETWAKGNWIVDVFFGYITVFFGAGIGGLLRYAANRAGIELGIAFAWNTLCVNVTGSLAMGLIAGWFAHRFHAGQTLQLFVTTGILGGYTTFSAFSVYAALLWERGQVWGSALYVVSSVLLSVGAAFLGLALMRQLAT
jgi:CrcB protein